MDYYKLAEEMQEKMFYLFRAKPRREFSESLRGEIPILHIITSHEDGILPSEISYMMDVSSARIAAALNNLEKKGLITREIDTSDRRRITVRITPKGKVFTNEHFRRMLEESAKLLSFLGEEDAGHFVRIIGILAEKVSVDNDMDAPGV